MKEVIASTGMAEGSGEKDGSNEIEDEEQVLGLQDDVQQDAEGDRNEEQKADDGLK